MQRACETCLVWTMRAFVFGLVWGPSVSACLFLILPSLSWAAGVVWCLPLLLVAWRTTRFYLLVCHTDPGGLPRDDWVPAPDELRLLQSVVGAKPWAEMRDERRLAFCKHCQRHRPLRSHHCSDCNRCVLRQDHHCPWVTNCVGYHNHKYFVQFMFHAVVGLNYVLFWVIWRAFKVFTPGRLPGQLPDVAASTVITVAIDGILSVALMLAISMLLSYQLWCISVNTTTIEHYDYSRRKRWAKRQQTKFIYPFDHGRLRNLRAVLGDTWTDWLSVTPTRGDGIHEPISAKFLRSLDKGDVHWNVLEDTDEHDKKLVKVV